MIAFVNNQFIEEEKATLGITDLSIQRGSLLILPGAVHAYIHAE